MRTSVGLAVLASGALLALSGCAAGSGGCAPIWPAGGLAASVSVSGGFGDSDLDVRLPTPLVADAPSTAVLDAGDGPLVPRDAIVSTTVTIVDADGVPVTGGPATWPVAETTPALTTAAACVPVGSRVVAVGPAEDLLGEDVLARTGGEVAPEDTLAFVVDVRSAHLSRANGAPQLPQAGLPTVSLAPDGRPGLTFTGADAPAETRLVALKAGDGAEIADGDAVLVKFTTVPWQGRTVTETTWNGPAPGSVVVGDEAAWPWGSLLAGQRIGSQLLIVIPSADPSGTAAVTVVDLLGILAE